MNTPTPTIEISRNKPAMILILIDRSYSMECVVDGDGRSLATVVADAVNDTIHNISLRCITDPVEGPRPYFEIGLIGYGRSALGDQQQVESAFGGQLAGRDTVSSAELAHHPIRIVERNGGPDFDGQTIRVPEWIEPHAGYGTPMCEAIYRAGTLAADFCRRHPDSYPPIVINLTDGEVTDEPFAPSGDARRVRLEEWAERLTSLRTTHGPLRFLNAFVTASQTDSTWFPNTPSGLPRPGQRLFSISSQLPEDLSIAAARDHRWSGPGARALLVNASPAELSDFLDIGTRVDNSKIGD